MNKKFLQQLKQKLEKEKKDVKKELQSFAEEDKELKGDWDTRFPSLGKEANDPSLEKAADEVEEYETLLPIEFSLEKKLQDINLALGKMKRDTYGVCEKCKKTISAERLKVFPTARTCKKCK
jgi:DnaK suppressor protein